MIKKGFAPIIAILVLGLVGGITIFFIKTISSDQQAVSETDQKRTIGESFFNDLLDKSLESTGETPNHSQPESKATLPPANVPIETNPTNSPDSQSNNNNSSSPNCSYDLGSATGAVKIYFQPQTGHLTSSIKGELKAESGCKVLDGRSTDTLEYFGTISTREVIFSSVPPGNYSVRYSFAGSWSGYQSVTATSGSLATINANVSGDNPPSTPTPGFTPVCSGISVYPSSQGTAPFTADFSGRGSYSMDYSPAGYVWDFTGDGSWDTSASGNAVNYTYSTPGTYTVKMKTVTGVWESSICQTTITVN